MHRTTEQLTVLLDHITASPADEGIIEMVVRRPAEGEREIVEEAMIDTEVGLFGDNWKARGSRFRPDGSANPEAQLTLMNSRMADAVAGTRDRWALAGDQIYVDMDLSIDNLPPGSRLLLGEAVIEVSAQPHTGCPKFKERFGADALKFANGSTGSPLRLRGVNAKVIAGGRVGVGDTLKKL